MRDWLGAASKLAQGRAGGIALAPAKQADAVRGVGQRAEQLQVPLCAERRAAFHQRAPASLHIRRGRDDEVDEATRVCAGQFACSNALARQRHEPAQGDHGINRVGGLWQQRAEFGAHRGVLDFGHLTLQRAPVDRGQLEDLGDQLVRLRARRTLRQAVPVGLELGEKAGGDLVVDRIAQRLELGIGRVNAHGQDADLLDLTHIFANEEALLQLVGEKEMACLAELGSGQIALEEARGRGDFVFGAGEAAEGPQLAELVARVGLDEVVLQDVSAHQVVVVGKCIPEVEIAREDVADVHALLRQRFGPRRAVRGAEDGVLAADSDLPARAPDGNLTPVRAHADVLGIRSFELAHTEREVVAQRLLLLGRKLGAAERRGVESGTDDEE